jgi:hypothetical protein
MQCLEVSSLRNGSRGPISSGNLSGPIELVRSIFIVSLFTLFFNLRRRQDLRRMASLRTTPFNPLLFVNARLADHGPDSFGRITIAGNTDFNTPDLYAIFPRFNPGLVGTFQRFLVTKAVLFQKICDIFITPIA